MALSDIHQLYEANDQIALITAISMTEVSGKKMDLYAGLAKEKDVREFFEERASRMKRKTLDLRKHLDRMRGE
ncbi:MAG: hypothetical protein ACYC2T_05100 [Bacillota bacterium]